MKVATFFYGSYINPRVLAEVEIALERPEVVCLPGFDIRIAPLANVVRDPERVVYGVLTRVTHAELGRLYAHARRVLGGVYLPEAVAVQDAAGRVLPALCYVSHDMQPAPAANDYVDRIVEPARAHGFPDWYVARLESFRPVAAGAST